MEDYSELLESLDEILQEEHDVEIAASAAAIRALLAENAELNAMMDKMEAEVGDIFQQYVDANENRIELEADLKRLEYWVAADRVRIAELEAENRYLCTALWKAATKEGEECDERNV
jgi:cupin superfamily acireductone dioxygenase involved in methionine salvage